MALTPNERLILERLIEGKKAKHIGRELEVSDITVRGYYRIICAKMDAPTILAAAVKYACPNRGTPDNETD